ncbi:PREDICTED: cation/H(+) antiporter 15-like [Ipomoea nil]|uniref:cation/H(+) antiporter 15-like n=1 Tax=Ipomoea nil TaxID=35883 RepID=UPI0009015A0A|nr:PREDICTED: cation/H(+) antiporter 15-like [Ipomoea nil]
MENSAPPAPPPPGQLPGAIEDYCRADIHVHSRGFWDNDPTDPRPFLGYSLPLLLLQLCIIFVLTQLLHLLMKRARMPRVVSELLAGIILGPTVLGQIPTFTETFFPAEGQTYLDLLSKIGFIYATFMCGVKMDPKMVLKCGKKAFTIGVTAVMVPFAVFTKISKGLDHSEISRYRRLSVKAIFSIQFLSSFPVTASLLVDLKIINSELGRLALATTLVSDLVSNGVSTVFSIIKIATMTTMPVLSVHSLVMTTAFILITFVVVRPLSARVIKMTPEGRPVDTSFVIFMTFFVLFTVVVTDNVGISYQYGPFLLGLVVPDGPPLGSTLVDKLDTIISGLFGPLFVAYCGLRVNLIELYDLEFVAVIWVTIALSFLSKYFTVLLTSLACNVPLKGAASLAFMMNTQGFIQMSFYFNNAVNQTFDAETFSMLTSSVIVTAAASYIFVGFLHDYSRTYAGYRKRNIENSSLTSELRIMSCAYRPDDVLAAKKLLDVSFPCKGSPISVYALHLVELVGQATPLLIDHQLGQKHSSQVSNARSQKILDMFQSFEMQHLESATVQFFTAISMPKFMHHDICSLAFDKLTFFIMLPFHRRWNQQGRLISDSTMLRTINCNVLDMAPCSIGVLIDRHKIRKKMPAGPSAAYRVAVIFMGGSDDREALAYGRRMSMSLEVEFSLIRLVPLNPDMAENQWDTVLDAEMLKSVRVLGQQQDNIVYREESVSDGAESALIVHAMEEAFDLILVGRRHKDNTPQLSGLTEWNDLPELGPLGDMLAAADINFPVSVLVCQQQPLQQK